jgi:peroxiredoxin
MKSKLLRWAYVVAILGWGGIAWATYRWRGDALPAAPPASPATRAEKHYVTPHQLAESGAMRDRKITPLMTMTSDGRRVPWQEWIGDRPAVLVFIKKDCPCSVEFEPFFHRLHRGYQAGVQFLGVIDAGPADARRYAEANRVPYPVLADPEHAIIRRFRAENGGYVVLLRRDSSVDTLWPGCSATMMRELSVRIAAVAGIGEQPIDVTDLPAVLTTGCPFAS